MVEIKSIKFHLMSPEYIKNMAVMEVTTSEVYDSDAYPIEGGVMDPRMGVIDPGMRCKTCGGRSGECPGHFGYIQLAKPVFNILFINHIKNLLELVCHKCGALLLDKNATGEIDLSLDDIPAIKNKRLSKCPKCGEPAPKLKFERPMTFIRDGEVLNPEVVREIFEKISDEDVEWLGIRGGRPEWMILTILPVPPITARPSIILEDGERSEDDLTHKLVDIVRTNNRLANNLQIGAPEFIIDDLWELLQYHVATFFKNNVSGLPPARHRSGRELKTLAQRLKSKEGRFRSNLTGKRVDFSARTVISPDPNIDVNEVGVPEVVARELTVPIMVTEDNIEELRACVLRGPNQKNGANYVKRPDGLKKKITETTKDLIAEELAPGYIVERHIQDGDVVLFNRQPSLHRMSIMAHRVRIMPYRTFRLNLTVCPPYNADFDGDEMNLHVPQTAEARAEAEQLMLVQENIRSPRFGGPIIGATQDFISGAYLLTKKDTVIPRERIAQYLARIGRTDVKLDKKEYTGKELFSMILPEDLNISFRSNICLKHDKCEKENCPLDAFVSIKNGKLVSGVIDEKAISPFKGRLLDHIDLEYGHDRARRFLMDVTLLTTMFLNDRGFTISTSEEEIPEEAMAKIEEIKARHLEEVDRILERARKGEIEPRPGRTFEETVEDMILMEMDKMMTEAQKVIFEHARENDALVMAKTGARGSIQNLTFMAAMVGQVRSRGRRPSRGYKGRTLPHFKKGDLSPMARGFVSSSFKKGLNPIEFFFEALKGREGIMDSSLKTRISGYMQRRLVNALQDIIVKKDFTARDGRGTVVQFVAGEDGIDPSKSDNGLLINVDKHKD